MFRVKICGVTTPADAAQAVAAGADAIGLNFYAKSPRCVSVEAARDVADAARGALRVGVFVNASAGEITAIAVLAGLNAIQLHGDEPASLLAELPAALPVVRAVRVGTEGLAPALEWLEQARRLSRPVAALLADAAAAGAYGGSGKTADWRVLAEERGRLGETPLVLAGGLTPENVAEAIRLVAPDGVDTASGVEQSPGRKDADKVAQFVQRAAEAFGAAR
ncbi:phosphoribosylanthranilate isomerase [Botrimarina sp.]|uniref:phosphoribosylanthranilate isomerase n=1 Tax=Botrimarina sp. TaxID=2795802 RepID=UPI0032EB03D9